MEKLTSEGKCVFCEKKYQHNGIAKHLSSHLRKMEKEKPSSKKAYHIKVSADIMFLDLLVSATSTFNDIDYFLREIWLDCCGHLSSFQIKSKSYDFDENSYGEDLDNPLSATLKKGLKINYEYDFGSTTPLDIKVMNEYQIDAPTGILLMSRNEPLEIMCHSCSKKPAVTICSTCVYSGPNMFCKNCAKKHAKSCEDFADYSEMPVINSPRMGVCAYDGGTIDRERDGVWKG